MKRLAVAAVAALAISFGFGASEAKAQNVRVQVQVYGGNGGIYYQQRGIQQNYFGFGQGFSYQYYQGPGAPFGVYQYRTFPTYPQYNYRPAYPYGYNPYYNPYRRW